MNINAAFAQYYIDSDYDTYEHKEDLKQLGFRWDPEKKAWWHKDEAERDAAEGWLPMKSEAEDRREREDDRRYGGLW